MTPDSKTETPQRVGPLAPGSVLFALFKHMSDEHGLTLLESEMTEIVRIVNDALDERLRWWIENAEAIAKERGELFRAGEKMRSYIASDYPLSVSRSMLEAWDAARAKHEANAASEPRDTRP